MSQVGKENSTAVAGVHGKQVWRAPKLNRLEATDAEVGPRKLNDGLFTSS